MKATNYNYESPWRPNYEAKAITVWGIFLLLTCIVAFVTKMPKGPFYWMIGVIVTMSITKVRPAWDLWILQKNLKGKKLEFVSIPKLLKKLKGDDTKAWLGKGFIWEQQHTQRVHEILKRSISDTVKQKAKDLEDGNRIGAKWIHGVEPKEQDLFQAIAHANGMTLITGTTGSGKTRLLDLIISQTIARMETAIILDPKGDKELKDLARQSCKEMGQASRFLFFHPAFPMESCRIDPFANYTRVTEVATRISNLIAAEDSFKDFAWMAADNIAQALVLTGQRPSLVSIKRFIQSGFDSIVWKSIAAYFEKSVPETAEHVSGKALVENTLRVIPVDEHRKRAIAMVMLYDRWKDKWGKPEVDGIASMMTHDPAHFKKITANLMPTLNMLTSGPLADLLSPNYEDHEDTRPIVDTSTIIDQNKVLYVGLDSLSDSVVAQAIGTLLLGDLASTAGSRYNNQTLDQYVNVFIDEAAEIFCTPALMLLNKGRGAKFRVYVATQTIADFEAKLGGEAQAMQVLGNLNNLISLRVIDPKTQEFVVKNLPKTTVKTVTNSQSYNVGADSPLEFSASLGERLVEEEADLFPQQLLGMLPNLEYIAKISGGTIIKARLPILEAEDAAKEKKNNIIQFLVPKIFKPKTNSKTHSNDLKKAA